MDPKDIDPARYYSVRALTMMNILPWRSAYTVAKVMREKKWQDIFHPVMDQKSNGVRVHILGSNIVRYMEMVKSGEISSIDENDHGKKTD